MTPTAQFKTDLYVDLSRQDLQTPPPLTVLSPEDGLCSRGLWVSTGVGRRKTSDQID